MNEFGMKPLGLSINLHTVGHGRARTILQEVLGALEWLYGEGFIHGDVRWDNILCQPLRTYGLWQFNH